MPTREWWTKLLAAIDAKDTPAFLDFLTDDAEFRFANAPPVHGRDAIGAAVSGFFAAIKSSRHRMLHAWEDAASAVCEGEVTYTRHDGSAITLPFVDVLYFRGERAARYLIYIDLNPLFAPG